MCYFIIKNIIICFLNQEIRAKSQAAHYNEKYARLNCNLQEKRSIKKILKNYELDISSSSTPPIDY